MNITKKEENGRLGYIDFLKFIGLTGIIIAHVGPPSWLTFLRNFDVPFMVILSALLGKTSYQKHLANKKPPLLYCLNRAKRLVFPAWIFIVIYFCVNYALYGRTYDFLFYVYSFCLTRYGMGYVWILLIYLYSALLIPLFNKLNLSKIGIVCIFLIYVIYEFAFYFQLGISNKFIETTFYYIIPYGLLTYIGFNYNQIKYKWKIAIAIISSLLCICLAIYYWQSLGSLQNVQIAKYPPRLYYLTFGISISFILLLICERWPLKFYNNVFFRFFSRNSLWIYLWHILMLELYNFLKLPQLWILKFAVVCSASALLVLLITTIVDKIAKKHPFPFFKYLKG